MDHPSTPMGTSISRLAFLKGAGAAGLAAGALGTAAFLGRGEHAAVAAEGTSATTDAATTAQDTAAQDSLAMRTFGDNTAYLPVEKAEWTQLVGPVGFEERAIDASEITRTDTCDFLVVGCGISGMIAALKAADEGADVIGIEKMATGRNLWESAGGYNTKAQQEIDNVPDPAEYAEAIFRASYWRARADVVWSFINNSGPAIDFMNEMLAKAGKGVSFYSTVQGPATYGMDVIQAEHKIQYPEDVEWNSWLKGPIAFDSLMTTAATYENLDLRYNTAGVQLTRDESGRVTGVIAKDAEGYYAIEAAKGVLLATGGYEANPALMQAWTRPEDYKNACTYAPGMGPTGDGHLMGLQVGAQMDPVPHCIMTFRSGLPNAPLDSSLVNKCFSPSIWVNFQGKRFVNESLPHNCVANAISTQGVSGKNVWFLFDSAIANSAAEANPGLFDDFEELKGKGYLVEGQTISELAEAMGVDPEVLEETVATYNGYFDAAEPVDLEYRRDLSKLAPLAEGPFYACVHVSKVLVTVSGLIINEHMQVVDNKEEVIEGLYAAGNASGGMFSGSYPRHLPATSVGRCVAGGYAAAVHALETSGVASGRPNGSFAQPREQGAAMLPADPNGFDAQYLETYGSYEDIAALTADYGDSNPHLSTHGGYASCQSCHDEVPAVKEVNACNTCHDWPRVEQSALPVVE